MQLSEYLSTVEENDPTKKSKKNDDISAIEDSPLMLFAKAVFNNDLLLLEVIKHCGFVFSFYVLSRVCKSWYSAVNTAFKDRFKKQEIFVYLPDHGIIGHKNFKFFLYLHTVRHRYDPVNSDPWRERFRYVELVLPSISTVGDDQSLFKHERYCSLDKLLLRLHGLDRPGITKIPKMNWLEEWKKECPNEKREALHSFGVIIDEFYRNLIVSASYSKHKGGNFVRYHTLSPFNCRNNPGVISLWALAHFNHVYGFKQQQLGQCALDAWNAI